MPLAGTSIAGKILTSAKHGFLAIPSHNQALLPEAARFIDSNECQTMIAAARNVSGRTAEETLQAIDTACDKFIKNIEARFGRKEE